MLIKILGAALLPLLVPVLLLVLALGTIALVGLVLLVIRILMAGTWAMMKKAIEQRKQQK